MKGPQRIVWRVAAWRLSRHLDRDRLEAVLGDLTDEHRRLAANRGRWTADAWLLRECASIARSYRTDRRPGRAAGTRLEQAVTELHLAVRRLRAAPGVAVVALVSIALSLGVTTAVYSTVDAVAWTTSPIDDADQVAVVTRRTAGSREEWRWAVSEADFDELRDQLPRTTALAASTFLSGVLNDGARASVFLGQAVTGSFFQALRIPVALGRGLQEADDRRGAEPVVVLSHEFWQSASGGDETLLGRTVRIDDRPFVVVGVVARRFRNEHDLNGQFGPANGDIWIPLAARTPTSDAADQPTDATTTSHTPDLSVFARLPPGLPMQRFSEEVGRVGASLDQVTPLHRSTDPRPATRSWSARAASAVAREQAGAIPTAGNVIVLLVGLVLVVASTNIANLMLGRGASRQHEFSVRRALGATRGRLVREQCMEGVVLAVAGGLGAVITAQVAIRAISTDIPLMNGAILAVRPTLNSAALVAGGAALLLSLIVFGVIPVLQLTKASLRGTLAGDAVGSAPIRWKGRGRLIACQVTIATAFMLVAFAAARAVSVTTRQDPGFDLRHLAVASVNFGLKRQDPDQARQVVSALNEVLQRPLGFTSVALTTGLPLGDGRRVRRLARVSTIDGEPASQSAEPLVRAVPSSPTIFRTLGVPILRGRSFDGFDTATTPPVIVISEAVADRLFGTTDAVGRQLRYADLSGDESASRSVEVVGIARDISSWVGDFRFDTVYLPLAQQDARSVFIVGRADTDPASMLSTLTGLVRQADPDLAVEFSSPGTIVMTPRVVVLKVAALLSGGLAILAATLAMTGLYGVLSHVVGSRTREIGVRLALGADAHRLRGMVIRDGLRPVGWGLGVGLLAGVGGELVLRSIDIALSNSAIDVPAIAGATGILLAAGFLASALPAHRASRVDPNVALRNL